MSCQQTLVVRLRPGLHALPGVMSVLHARAVAVEALSYVVSDGIGYLRVCSVMTVDQAVRLAAQLDRRVDVLEVKVGDHNVSRQGTTGIMRQIGKGGTPSWAPVSVGPGEGPRALRR